MQEMACKYLYLLSCHLYYESEGPWFEPKWAYQ